MKPIKRNLLKTAFIAGCLVSVTANGFGQLVVDDTAVPDSLVASLVGAGVTVSGVTMDCPDGAYGFFDCFDCNVGITDGIILTSGYATNAEGPNNSGSMTGDNSAPGDPDLDAIPGILGTNDACALEFDITVVSDTVRFNYVFGSEEYLEYVGSFNDAFAFYISGPGIVGSANMALVPGTVTPVSINNVNTGSNPEYYIVNGTGFDPPYSTDNYYVQYDGITTVLEAKHSVIPCETYHLKMVIADDLDWAFDSGVFIEAGSLSSPGVTISYETHISGYDDVIEGCNNGEVTFELSFAPTDTFSVGLNIGGTAINGVDYPLLPDSLIFYPGDTMIVLTVAAYDDAITEGIETVVMSVDLACYTSSDDSLIVYIDDKLPVTVSPDTTICPGDTATLFAGGADTYSWNPPETLSSPLDDTVFAFPTETTTYIVTGIKYTCINTLPVTVSIYPSTANAGNDTLIYFGERAYLDADGGVSYVWTPGATLSDSLVENPFAEPEFTTNYMVTVTTEEGCVFTDDMNVVVVRPRSVEIPNAFTPNGDGINDVLHIVVLQNIELNSFVIFNRWGGKIFETNDILAGWDGTFNGIDQEIGSYMYIFVGTNEDQEEVKFTGTINLLR